MNKKEAIEKYRTKSKELRTKLSSPYGACSEIEEINSLIRQINYLKNMFGLTKEDLK